MSVQKTASDTAKLSHFLNELEDVKFSPEQNNVELVDDEDSTSEQDNTEVKLVDDDVTRKYVDGVMDRITAKKLERKTINEQIQAIFTEAESRGINRKGLKAAISRYELSEEQRDSMDFSYSLCCKIKDIVSQFQPGLFDDEQVNIERNP